MVIKSSYCYHINLPSAPWNQNSTRPANGLKIKDRGYDPLGVKTEMKKLAFYCRNRVFSSKVKNASSNVYDSDSATLKQRKKQKQKRTPSPPPPRSLRERCGERHSLKEKGQNATRACY